MIVKKLMSIDEPARHLPDAIPPTYCAAGEWTRVAHEWVTFAESSYYCSRCLMRLESEYLQSWLAASRQERLAEPLGAVSLESAVSAADALTLTRMERRMLVELASRPDSVVGYPELAGYMWGTSSTDASDRAAMRQHIAALRGKLSLLRADISTVASIGYRFQFVSAGETDVA